MKKIAFSGTLDPITNGHMWVIQEARAIADEVVILISENSLKTPQFSPEKRKIMIEQSVAAQGWSDVSVMMIKGDYTARAAKKQGIDYLIRGIRTTADFDYENLIQQANVDVVQGAKTLFVMPPRDLGSVSSSFVRSLQGPVGWHWNVKQFLPGPAYLFWIRDWLRKDWDALWQLGQADDADPELAAKADHWFNHLVGAYGSAARHYHNLDHLVHGLTEISAWAANTNAPQAAVDALKKAFWFHDAVYDVGGKSTSNEEDSAQLWLAAQLDLHDAEGPAMLIRATDRVRGDAISHPLRQAMQSVDLAILGQGEHIYDNYARAIRTEYAALDEQRYRQGRMQLLAGFLQKAQAGQLYADPYFADLYTQTALENLSREIAGLNS